MVLFLLWLPFEDTGIGLSAALAFGLCAWLTLRIVPNRPRRLAWPQVLAWGALFGTAVPLVTIALMAFKSGLHAHGFADFTVRQVWLTLNLIPLSMIVGLVLAGLVNLTSLKKRSSFD